MVEIETGLRENTVGAIEQFAAIASVDPLVAAMLLSGAIITGIAMTVFGITALGGVLSALKDGLSGEDTPNQPV